MLGFVQRFTQQPRPDGGQPPRGREASGDAQEAQLIERVTRRDQRAFETLYRIYHPRLVRFMSLVTARSTIVEEAVNDTMLVVWNRAHTYNGTCKVSTWIFAIAYRTVCKALRWQDVPSDPVDFDDQPSSDAGPEGIGNAREVRAALSLALESLSHEHRNVVVLTYFHDLPYAEIAQIMDCPIDTVKTRMLHARRKLRVLLRRDELGDIT
jgi:RNA polymerase sigma factor (sigma-70 family)